jgi:hypothetical protein
MVGRRADITAKPNSPRCLRRVVAVGVSVADDAISAPACSINVWSDAALFVAELICTT